mmetsp:Transcript_7850/g.13004  ORF Transcript_7850/g.13004 Transcript_7850/m.13004 type:complete len:286 (-) Transcript_7850:232-1089(-)|eukprot:CAMPEP_0174959624 /NCGR_PEP_ID=MMETSP0004_2-20121128/3279_1 /TAXON_ID=420556 /ORGANISM="Ochromonas sp., Strain CCMP1393" /LENGTH=285 /DNA_ID=CAMNT_0016207961 /DNA_START=27 /DNA_END=884 /DNA_ORIENTATION=+
MQRLCCLYKPTLLRSVPRGRCNQFSTAGSSYEYILAEKKGKVGLITLNRPKQLNALCNALVAEVIDAGQSFDKDAGVGAIVITGSDKAFAAGADIKEMSTLTYAQCYTQNLFAEWAEIPKISKPIVAAVSGYALGGGCELAMLCDMIIASESAKFGQPEINLGVIPGGGGTQRLVRAIGKSKAMEMVLTGKMIDAHQAERDGLVSRVVPNEDLLEEALKLGEKIASMSAPAVAMAKETVNASFEMSMQEGLRFERRIFHSMFSLDDQKEGMSAFLAKRPAEWSHK